MKFLLEIINVSACCNRAEILSLVKSRLKRVMKNDLNRELRVILTLKGKTNAQEELLKIGTLESLKEDANLFVWLNDPLVSVEIILATTGLYDFEKLKLELAQLDIPEYEEMGVPKDRFAFIADKLFHLMKYKLGERRALEFRRDLYKVMDKWGIVLSRGFWDELYRNDLGNEEY